MFSIFVRFHGSASAASLAISCVFDSITVSMMRSRLARSVDPVSVASTMASASTGGLTSVAPQENSTLTSTFSASKYALVTRTSSVAIVAPSKSVGFLKRESSGRRQHPAHLAEALLRVDQVGDAGQRVLRRAAELVFANPVLAGEAGVEHAVADVARHLLRADQHALELRDRQSTESTSACSRRS